MYTSTKNVQWLLEPLPIVRYAVTNGIAEQVWPFIPPNANLEKLVFPRIQALLPSRDEVKYALLLDLLWV